MKPQILLPKTGVLLDLKMGDHLYFLAGPIEGGGDWQRTAIFQLTRMDPGCIIACPRPYALESEMHAFSLPATMMGDRHALTFEKKSVWERYYMERAAHFGALIFWLSPEDHLNHTPGGKPHAFNTAGELGSWRIKNSKPQIHCLADQTKRHINMAVGIHPDFPTREVIQTNFDEDHPYQKPFPIYSTLEATLARAVELANATSPKPIVQI